MTWRSYEIPEVRVEFFILLKSLRYDNERKGVSGMSQVHMKGRAIQILEAKGPSWDYEVAKQVIEDYGLESDRRNRGTIRLWLVEYAASGLIETVGDAVDDGTYFGKDKLMRRYQITAFGRQRMQESGLL